MKRIILSLFSFFTFLVVFNACSTDVDLYADYKDITVVYGLLDSDADTNFIKINKAFLGPGNALEIAMIADSCNYPGKLDAKLIEYRANASGTNYQKTTEIPLDTITIHNKEQGIFYAPEQKVYYTTHRIKNNTSQYKYRYELIIDRGDTIISSITDMVGGGLFTIPQSVINLSAYASNGTLSWYACPNASIYEVVVKFYFTEVRGQDSVQRCLNWPMGSHPESQLVYEDGEYSIQYKPSMFFYNLAVMLGTDTLNNNVERLLFEPSIEVSVAAGGTELYNFITVNGPSNSIVQTIPEYTNIKGGYGVFSSRTMCKKRMRFTSSSLINLTSHQNWHFRQAQ